LGAVDACPVPLALRQIGLTRYEEGVTWMVVVMIIIIIMMMMMTIVMTIYNLLSAALARGRARTTVASACRQFDT